jgi:AcrR family transcriptional regulator
MSKTVEAVQMSRRERQKRERQARILDAAAVVFANKGYHQAKIRDIAELADVADGTIYNYYANKRELFLAMTHHVVADSAMDVLSEFQAESDRSFLTAVFDERFHFLERNSDFIRAMLAEVWTDEEFRRQYLEKVIAPLLVLIETNLQARIDAGTMRPVNTAVAIRAMVGSFLIFLLLSQPGHGGLNVDIGRDELVGALVDFFLHGLAACPMGEGRDA